MALGDYLSSLDLNPGTAQKLSTLAGVDSASMIPPPPPGAGDAEPAPVAPPVATGEQKPSAVQRFTEGALDGLKNAYNPLHGAQKYEEKLSAERKADEPFGPPAPPPDLEPKKLYGQAPIVVRQPQGGGGGHSAGWVPGTKSESRHEGMTPEELDKSEYHRDVAAGQRMLSADKHLEASQQQAASDVAYADAWREAAAQDKARQDRIALERQRYVEQEHQKLDALTLEAQKKVDPEAARGSSGAQLMAAIGIAMGAYGASITGGPNGAYQIVKDRINDNLDAQKSNIANAGKSLDREQSLYHQNLDAFGDKERASVATKLQLLEQAKAEAAKSYALAKNTANEGDYHALVANFNDDIAKGKKEFALLVHTDVNTQATAHYQQATAGAGPQYGLGDAGHDPEYVPSLQGYATTKEDATTAKDHDFRTRTINATLGKVREILKESEGLTAWKPADIKRRRELQGQLDSLSNSAAVKQTVKEGQGAQSRGDKEVSDQTLGLLGSKVWGPEYLIPGASTYMDGVNRKNASVAESVQERALEEHRRLGESLNITPGKRVLVQDKNGNLQPHRVLTGERTPLTSPSVGIDDVLPKPKGRAQ